MKTSKLSDHILKALVVLLLITAVATVLITPDPTDDVHAVVRSHSLFHAPALAASLVILLTLLVAESLRRREAVVPTSSTSLQLLGTCRRCGSFPATRRDSERCGPGSLRPLTQPQDLFEPGRGAYVAHTDGK